MNLNLNIDVRTIFAVGVILVVCNLVFGMIGIGFFGGLVILVIATVVAGLITNMFGMMLTIKEGLTPEENQVWQNFAIFARNELKVPNNAKITFRLGVSDGQNWATHEYDNGKHIVTVYTNPRKFRARLHVVLENTAHELGHVLQVETGMLCDVSGVKYWDGKPEQEWLDQCGNKVEKSPWEKHARECARNAIKAWTKQHGENKLHDFFTAAKAKVGM